LRADRSMYEDSKCTRSALSRRMSRLIASQSVSQSATAAADCNERSNEGIDGTDGSDGQILCVRVCVCVCVCVMCLYTLLECLQCTRAPVGTGRTDRRIDRYWPSCMLTNRFVFYDLTSDSVWRMHGRSDPYPDPTDQMPQAASSSCAA
jgi:hypothetical protein